MVREAAYRNSRALKVRAELESQFDSLRNVCDVGQAAKLLGLLSLAGKKLITNSSVAGWLRA